MMTGRNRFQTTGILTHWKENAEPAYCEHINGTKVWWQLVCWGQLSPYYVGFDLSSTDPEYGPMTVF